MWIPKGEALIRGRRLLEARRLLEEMQTYRRTFVNYWRKRKEENLKDYFIKNLIGIIFFVLIIVIWFKNIYGVWHQKKTQ